MSDRRSAVLLHSVNRWLSRSAGGAEGDAALLRRYSAGREDAAFAALVGRHGPAVFGVCRRILGDHALAEDAFQATFLLLAQKAGQLRQPDRLAGWLHGVATKVAHRARQRLRPTAPLLDTALQAEPDPARREALLILDEELAGLRDAERLPLVLCYLEGLSHQEAARRLGWSSGSMSWRLQKAKAALHERLVRRGVFLSLAGLGLLCESLAEAGAPATWATAALRSASWVSLGQGPSAAAAQLAAETAVPAGVGYGLFGKSTLAVAVVLCSAGVGLGWLASAAQEPKANPPAAAPATPLTPLPAGALARLGSTAFRNQGLAYLIASRFSADGKTLEAITSNGEIQRWEFPSGKPLGVERRLKDLTPLGGYRHAEIKNDRFVRFEQDALKVFDFGTGRLLSTINLGGVKGSYRDAMLCDAGRHLAVSNVPPPQSEDQENKYADATVDFHDTATGTLAKSFPIPLGLSRFHLVDGGKNVIGVFRQADHQRLYLFDTMAWTKTELKSLDGWPGFVFHPTLPVAMVRHVVPAGEKTGKHVYKLWNWRTNELKDAKFSPEDGWGAQPQFIDDENVLWLTAKGETVVTNFLTGVESLRVRTGLAAGYADGEAPGGQWLALRLPSSGFIILDRKAKKLVAGAEGNLDSVVGLYFSLDGQTLLSRSRLDLQRWDLATRRAENPLTDTKTYFQRIGFLRDGRTVLLMTSEQDWSLFDFATLKRCGPKEATPAQQKEVSDLGAALRFTNDGRGRYLDKQPDAFTWIDPAAEKSIRFRLGEETRPWFGVALDPQGKWVLLAKRARNEFTPSPFLPATELVLFDLEKKQVGQRWTLSGTPAERTMGAVFSWDGARLALLQGTTLKVLDVATLKPIVEHKVAEPVTALAFSRDGQTLATGLANGTILIWPAK